MATKYWLFKSEPHVFSFNDLKNAPDSTTHWDGVRNYQARNMLRDQINPGDKVLYYHSNCDEIGIVGVAEVVRGGYPDHTARDPESHYYDPKATAENPIWYMVDIKWLQPFERTVTLKELKATTALQEMKVVQRGQRLSVQPVDKKHFDIVCKMGTRPA
jgi:predicted RNA-binding protein with PUA-like domain